MHGCRLASVVALGLPLSARAASQEFSHTPVLDTLVENSAMQLAPAGDSDRSGTVSFKWDSNEPFWISVGVIVFTATIVVIAVHESGDGPHISPEYPQ